LLLSEPIWGFVYFSFSKAACQLDISVKNITVKEYEKGRQRKSKGLGLDQTEQSNRNEITERELGISDFLKLDNCI